jgi:hypothetical protein
MKNVKQGLKEHSVTINNVKKLAIIVCTLARFFVDSASNFARNAGFGTAWIVYVGVL